MNIRIGVSLRAKLDFGEDMKSDDDGTISGPSQSRLLGSGQETDRTGESFATGSIHQAFMNQKIISRSLFRPFVTGT